MHLKVFVRPVATTVLTLELHDLLHNLDHELIRLPHLVHLETNGTFVGILIVVVLCELLQARLTSARSARWALEDLHRWHNERAHGALEVIRLECQPAVLVQIVATELYLGFG